MPLYNSRTKGKFDGSYTYYFAWYLEARRVALDLLRSTSIDVLHHVTYANYWIPSPLSDLGRPLVLGPVGGAEIVPPILFDCLSPRAKANEAIRALARSVGEALPTVKRGLRSSKIALGTTPDTSARLTHLGASRVSTMPAVALGEQDLRLGGAYAASTGERRGFVFVGRLLEWKGVYLALEALSRTRHKSTLTFIGRVAKAQANRLLERARRLGVQDRITLLGDVSRPDVMRRLASAEALLFPSMHDSGGYVCLEAQAVGTPVICLDTGGPPMLVDADVGRVVPLGTPQQVVQGLADAMDAIVEDPWRAVKNGEEARERVLSKHTWEVRSRQIDSYYATVVTKGDTL